MSAIARRLGLTVVDVYMGTFDFTVRCMVGDYEAGMKYAAHVFEVDFEYVVDGENFGYEARGKCYFRPGYVPIIWIPRRPHTAREHATLAHEIVHSVMHLFEWAHVPVNRDTEEVFAHAVGHIANGIYESFISKHKTHAVKDNKSINKLVERKKT